MALKRAVGFFEENLMRDLSHALKNSKFTSAPQIKHTKIKISHSFTHTKKKSKTYRKNPTRAPRAQVMSPDQEFQFLPLRVHELGNCIKRAKPITAYELLEQSLEKLYQKPAAASSIHTKH